MRTAALALVCTAGCAANPSGATNAIPVATIEPTSPDATIAAAYPPSFGVEGMALVHAGSFHRGCSPRDTFCYDNEKPAGLVHLAAFYIDRTEVTVGAYRRCVEARGCDDEGLDSHSPTTSTDFGPSQGLNDSTSDPAVPDPDCNWRHQSRSEHPMNCVTWHQAAAFCAWTGKRLPTEAEWEKAARGRGTGIYPWGEAPVNCERAIMDNGCGAGSTAPVGSRASGQSPYGVFDMTGNVWEWTADWYQADAYATPRDENPRGPATGIFRVVKGGGWTDAIRGEMNSLRISNRYSYSPHLRFVYIGFRCARDAGHR